MSRQSQPALDKSGYLSLDTIAALASGFGGAVGVVRVSGPGSFNCLSQIAGVDAVSIEPRKLQLVRLVDANGSCLDEALVVRFPNPDSYTGEDVVELHIHGGSFTSFRVLEELARLGARPALPGEFSFRAIRNGKMTLSKAEAVADLIASSNEAAAQLALEKMSGTQARLFDILAENLRATAALAEIGIDFSDQDVEEVGLPSLKKRVLARLETLETLAKTYGRGVKIQEGLRIAFVGLPNAGKSSFFNALLGEDRSIVSEIAGTTRDLVHERMTLRGPNYSATLRLEDTAGLRNTLDSVEKMGMDRTRKSASAADLVLCIVDPTQSLDGAFTQWQDLDCSPTKCLGIMTKSDLVSSNEINRIFDRFIPSGIPAWIPVSSKESDGLARAVQAITDFCGTLLKREKGEVLLTRLEHLSSVESSIGHLRRALEASEIELFASDIRQSLHALGPLIGETPSDDILGKIFSSFCIGK